MPQSDILKRYLDAGLAFTQMTRERAEAIVQELVKAGEVRRKEAEKNIEELLERSRRNTEDLVGIIRREVAEQLRSLGLDDLAKRAGGGGRTAPGGDTPTEGPITTPTTKAAKKAPKKSSAPKPAKAKPAGGSSAKANPAGGSSAKANPAGGSSAKANPAGGSSAKANPAGGSSAKANKAAPTKKAAVKKAAKKSAKKASG